MSPTLTLPPTETKKPKTPKVTPDAFAHTMASLLDEADLGLLLCAATLLLGICARLGPGACMRCCFGCAAVIDWLTY